ncbi:MAG: TRAP transporter large permease subunit, partial [Pseudomonadota bacterium]|nr:TRAP transporter large permease subunit [Pseudomonadota bacterium]
MRKEFLFGFTIMGLIILPTLIFMPWTNLTQGHLGLMMLSLVVVTIMLGFPTAFTLMGMGMFFAWLAYHSVNPDLAVRQVLDLMVQRTYGVMNNESLLAIPLFVFMGYLVERAALIERLFKSLHLALSRVPGSLAVATIITCAIFATATGIVGAVVTLMGLLALPAMLRAGYSVQLSAGSITAGGCLGILIPPSVLLIVYGATAGVSVVKLYAGAFFPGLMLAMLYVGYVIIVAKIKPSLAPPLPESERAVPLPAANRALSGRGRNSLVVLGKSLFAPPPPGVARRTIAAQFLVALLPILALGTIIALTLNLATRAPEVVDTTGLERSGFETEAAPSTGAGLAEPPTEGTGLGEPPAEGGLSEPPAEPAAASAA